MIFNLVLSLYNKSSEFIFKAKEISILIPVINENTQVRIVKVFILTKKRTRQRPFCVRNNNYYLIVAPITFAFTLVDCFQNPILYSIVYLGFKNTSTLGLSVTSL